MATAITSDVAFALQQPTVRPACLVTLHTSSGDVFRCAVDTVTWSGLTFAARLQTPPRVSFSPSAPERGIVGATTLQLELVDPDGQFGQYRPGYFEGSSCSVQYVLLDVTSNPLRSIGFGISDVAKPDLRSLTLRGEDGFSAVRRKGWPDDRLLIANLSSLGTGARGGFAIMPRPQPHVEGPSRTLPIKLGQCIAPAVLQWSRQLSDASSEPPSPGDGSTTFYGPLMSLPLSLVGPRFNIVQRWNDNWSQVASVREVEFDTLLGPDPFTGEGPIWWLVHCGVPIHEGFEVVPLYDGQMVKKPTSGTVYWERRHTVTPPEVLQLLVDSSFHGFLAAGIPVHAQTGSWHVAYRGNVTDVGLGVDAGSASNVAWHGFHGYIAEQRPLEQWVGEVLHDGMMGVVWNDQLRGIALPFSRAAVASFTTANIVRDTLAWQDVAPSQLETTRTVFFRRQSRDVEPTTSYTWSALAGGGSVSRVSNFLGHTIAAWRPAQFWAKREAYGRRRYTFHTGLFAAALEQHDLITLHYPTAGASGQLCEVDAVELLPDWTVRVQARESHYDLFTFTNTPGLDWQPDLAFAQRVAFPASSWALGTTGSSFRVNHVLIGPPDFAAPVFADANLTATSYPSSLVTGTNSTADFWIANIANAGATVSQFERILHGWDLQRRG